MRPYQIDMANLEEVVQKGVLKNGKKGVIKIATSLKKIFQHRYFAANFAKFLRQPFLHNTSEQLLLKQLPEMCVEQIRVGVTKMVWIC